MVIMVGVVEILQSIAGAWPYVFLEFYGNDGKVAGFSGTEKRMKKNRMIYILGCPNDSVLCFARRRDIRFCLVRPVTTVPCLFTCLLELPRQNVVFPNGGHNTTKPKKTKCLHLHVGRT